MIILLKDRATSEEIEKAAIELDGYIKIVVDLDNKIMTIGGERHVDGEQILLKHGSKQDGLWGGGLDLETKEIDYNSVINLRPQQNNPSRDVLSLEIRKEFDKLVQEFLL